MGGFLELSMGNSTSSETKMSEWRDTPFTTPEDTLDGLNKYKAALNNNLYHLVYN